MSDSHEVILNRMLNNIDESYDRSKGSFAYDILSSAAKEFEIGYSENEKKTINNHIANASGRELEELVKQYANITRKKSTYASGKVYIDAEPGSKFLTGNLVSIGYVNYAADKDYIADSNGVIEAYVVCTELGNIGNTKENTIIYFPRTISGLKSVTNRDKFDNGYDEETDEELKERYYEKIGNPETSSNPAQYKAWAKSVVGVGDAKVIPRWDGPGTIKIVLIDSNKEPSNEELNNKVKDYIEEVREACSGELTVTSATSVIINIKVSLKFNTLNYTNEEIRKHIEDNVNKYLKEVSFDDDSSINYFAISNEILNSDGVSKILGLKINDGTSDINIIGTQIAKLGVIEYE